MPQEIDYYQGAEPDAEPSEVTETETETTSGNGDEAGETSALLPKSMLGEVEPGQTITLKVVHVYEDEVEVEKVGEETPPETPMGEAESGLEKLARPGMGSPGVPMEA